MGLVLAGFVAAGHGWGVNSGLFLDDHSHFAKLKASDWSFRSVVESAWLGIVGDVLDVWNRHETGLRFFRPIAFWTMKIEYTLAGWRPSVMHLFSLGWHWAVCMLVVGLAFRCFGKAGWAAAAGCVFAVHPGQVACTYWVASQTELQVTVWLLLAVLCYARYSGWPERLFAPRRDWYPGGSLPLSRPIWLLPAMCCFVMALGCRENAVMFLPLVFLGDVLFRGLSAGRIAHAPGRMRWGAYLGLAALFAVYLWIRWATLGGFPLPGKPYLITLDDPRFWPFIFDKFVLNMLAIFAYIPVVPLGGLTFFQARPSQFYLPFLGVVVGWIGLFWAFRRRPGVYLAFGWLVLMMLPLLPVFSSPHHLYLPTVGFALILASALGLAGDLFAEPGTRASGLRGAVALILVVVHGVGLTFGCWAMGWVYGSSTGIEDLVLAGVKETRTKPIRDGDHLFFINIPMMAYYVIPALEQETGLRNLHGHALTFSPTPMLMDQPGRVEQVDEYTLRVSVDGDPYFGGVSGRVLLEGMGMERMPAQGQTIDAGLYRVTIDRADETGIRSLIFRFNQPLNSPEYHFFLTSRERMAYALLFEQQEPEFRTASYENTKVRAGPKEQPIPRSEPDPGR